MTKEQVLKEFSQYRINELEIDKIVAFYKAGAELLSSAIGNRILTEALPLKMTLNSIKYVVVQIMELKHGDKTN